MKRNIYPLLPKIVAMAFTLLFFAPLGRTQITVSGVLETTGAEKASGFAIAVTGTENKIAYTNAQGEYSFSLQAGGAYNIRPLSCDQNPLNGVSTYDLVLMAKHYTGLELLNSPYRIIAADIDNSNSADIQDSVVLRDLILGITTEIPGGNFRFVLKNYVFPDPLNPFSPAFPESYSIADLQADIADVDFLAIKKGDVNSTAVGPFECTDPQLYARIIGKVYHDQNADCQYDTNETGLNGWTVSASDGTNTYYGTTNHLGDYSISALPGTFDVVLSNPQGLWGGCADTVAGVQVSLQDIGLANFGLQPQILCPAMQVDLSTPVLRRCFDNHYKIQYCNTGTVMAENARVEVRFDTFFNVLSSNLPWSIINGNTYTFPVGDVPAGECGSFVVVFNLSCEATLGQTHCSEAQIFPDTFCSAPGAWNGAKLRVTGYCTGNEVKFVIVNQGTDMLAASNYIVVEDIVVMTPPVNNPFTLQGGNSEVITLPANGATWRLEAEQPVGYPWGEIASATVEGCGTNNNGDFSLGFVNKFAPDDQSPIIDIDCQENVGSFDPNDKQGFPTGVLAEHYIPLEQPIEYLIRFQNTGTDTAFTVVVRDTLDASLALETLRPQGSSHDYTFSFVGQNVAQFMFTHILLPDSNVNEPASHGYVKFVVSPKKGLPNSTLVQNRAAIFFDFNEPVITNTTWHTLGEKYLDVSNVVFRPGIGLTVFPNPAIETTTFLLKSISPVQGTLEVFDWSGRLVSEQRFAHNQFDYQCNTLQAGTYFFRIISEGQALAAGKLVVLRP